jgi:hypothetical protein
MDSALDIIIPPEIKDDAFYNCIMHIASQVDIHNILEIGSSSGAGSTEALVRGILKNSNKIDLYCMEVSKTRFCELQKCYELLDFVHCYNASSVSLSDFPDLDTVTQFYSSIRSNLNRYPLEIVLQWLAQDLEYVEKSGSFKDGIKLIKQEQNINFFDLVLIDGSEFTGYAELEQVYGANYILLDDVTTYKNYVSRLRLLASPDYELIEEDLNCRNGYSVFRRAQNGKTSISQELPIHFFTIVLNGMPYIKYHINVLQNLPFSWHWHIIEGVASLSYDTSWSLQFGGRIPENLHNQGRSVDGTSEYIDGVASTWPENITVYRKPLGEFWNGKCEMVNTPLHEIPEECLLWEIDADEIWILPQIIRLRQMFLENPVKSAAYYWCSFFVGENLVVSTRDCYSQHPNAEWLRTWRYKPGDFWLAHEPPTLLRPFPNGVVTDLACNAFSNRETEENGLVFQHYAYATPDQLQFKESYYGYSGALKKWYALQQQKKFPVFLRDYFPWVQDDTQVSCVEECNVKPVLTSDFIRQRSFKDTSLEIFDFEKLKETNFLAIPDITLSEDNLYLVIENLLHDVSEWENKGEVCLLIAPGIGCQESLSLLEILISVAVTNLMFSNIDFSEGPEILVLESLSILDDPQIQSRVQARICFGGEDKYAIDQLPTSLRATALQSKRVS